MKTDFQERIDEYILGRMSDEEKAQFEAEVNQDESKKEQLEFTRNIKDAISSREDKLAKMRMMKRNYDYEHRQVAATMLPTGTNDCCYAPQYAVKKKPSRRIWWWASGIAVVLVIGLFVVVPFRNEMLPIDYSPNEVIRGEENDVFDMGAPVLNDSIKNDTILHRDTVIVIKETNE